MDTSGVIQFIVLIILLILSAFFSSAETAFSTVNRVRMRSLEEEGNKRAAIVNKILNNYSKMISAILIGNNIVNITASALATTLALRIHLIVGIATAILTVVVLLFGEIVPKTWAMINGERIALAYCKIIYGLMQLLTPVIFLIDKLSGAILAFLHIDPKKKGITVTESELKTYVDVSHEEGVIESEEKEMIYNVFDFSDAVAKDIMIPRIHMVSVSVDADYHTILNIFRESMYTRLPVYEGDKDNMIGILNVKDFILNTSPSKFSVRKILREAHYTYEFKKSSDLLLEMREITKSVAFVLNEYGATVGMITLEDLLEEIVGQIRDEYDADEAEFIKPLGERSYLIEGSMNLDDINDALEIDLTSEDYDSIGGIMIEQLDHLPEDGEEAILPDGTRLKVSGVTQNRIEKVILTLPDPELSSESVLAENGEENVKAEQE